MVAQAALVLPSDHTAADRTKCAVALRRADRLWKGWTEEKRKSCATCSEKLVTLTLQD